MLKYNFNSHQFIDALQFDPNMNLVETFVNIVRSPQYFQMQMVPKPNEVDTSDQALYHRFNQKLMQNKPGEFPYRYGSYFMHTADNSSKMFKFATYVNTTSQDSSAFLPHFMYQSILKAATGNPNLDFVIENAPFPLTKKDKFENSDFYASIFVSFAAGLSLSILPFQVVGRLVKDKEHGFKHLLIVSGVNWVPYYSHFLFFDLGTSVVTCTILALLFWNFTFFIYPFAQLAMMYCVQAFFESEQKARSVCFILNLVLSCVGSAVVYSLRMVEATAFTGDILMWVLRFISPSFCVCNSIIFQGTKKQLTIARTKIIRDISRKNRVWGGYVVPYEIGEDQIQDDCLMLVIVMIVYTVAFLFLYNSGYKEARKTS